jgi:hypothetical protein
MNCFWHSEDKKCVKFGKERFKPFSPKEFKRGIDFIKIIGYALQRKTCAKMQDVLDWSTRESFFEWSGNP